MFRRILLKQYLTGVRIFVTVGVIHTVLSQYPTILPETYRHWLNPSMQPDNFATLLLGVAVVVLLVELLASRLFAREERNKVLEQTDMLVQQLQLGKMVVGTSDKDARALLAQLEADLTAKETQIAALEKGRNHEDMSNRFAQLSVRQSALVTRIGMLNAKDSSVRLVSEGAEESLGSLRVAVAELEDAVGDTSRFEQAITNLEPRVRTLEEDKPILVMAQSRLRSLLGTVTTLQGDDGLPELLAEVSEQKTAIEDGLDKLSSYNGDDVHDLVVQSEEFVTAAATRIEPLNVLPEKLKAIKTTLGGFNEILKNLSDETEGVVALVEELTGAQTQIENLLDTLEAGSDSYNGNLERQVDKVEEARGDHERRAKDVQKHVVKLTSLLNGGRSAPAA